MLCVISHVVVVVLMDRVMKMAKLLSYLTYFSSSEERFDTEYFSSTEVGTQNPEQR